MDSVQSRNTAAHFHRLTRLEDPLQVPVQFSLNLLLPTELQEGAAVLYSFPLLGKFSIPCRREKQAALGTEVCRTVLLLEALCLEAGSYQLPNTHLTHHML